MDKKHKGSHSELLAAAWLLAQGYEVFTNVSDHGPMDLMAYNVETRETILIDVKTMQFDKRGRYSLNSTANQRTELQRALGVKILYVSDKFIEWANYYDIPKDQWYPSKPNN